MTAHATLSGLRVLTNNTIVLIFFVNHTIRERTIFINSGSKWIAQWKRTKGLKAFNGEP